MGNLDVLNDTLSNVVTELCGVNIKLNPFNGCLTDFNRFCIVEFSHALNFSEDYMVSVLENVTLVLVHVDLGLFSFLNLHNDEVFGLFSIMVIDNVLVTIVNEGGAPWAESL